MAVALQEQLDEHRQRVDVDHYDITIGELLRMSGAGELKIAPVYQRKFRWTPVDESRLIESLFLGLPVPSVYVATNDDATWDVVDGLQRISTLIHFVAEPRALLDQIGKKEPLRLEGLEELDQFNGMRYDDLPGPIRLAFNRRALRVTALSDKSEYQARFDLFDRLNRGGIALTAQEVRAAIFQGPFNDLLRELADDPNFRSLLKLQRRAQDDGTREELVLKFFAYLEGRERFRGAVTEFLNTYMHENAECFDVDEGRTLFRAVVSQLGAIVGGPFVRSNYANTPLNQFEAVLVAAGELIREETPIVAPVAGWPDDDVLVDASTKGTNTPAALATRINRAKELLSRRE